MFLFYMFPYLKHPQSQYLPTDSLPAMYLKSVCLPVNMRSLIQ